MRLVVDARIGANCVPSEKMAPNKGICLRCVLVNVGESGIMSCAVARGIVS